MKTTIEFEVGDVVMLKSGGAAMTIANIAANGIACEWFDTGLVPQHRIFVPDVLQACPGFVPKWISFHERISA